MRGSPSVRTKNSSTGPLEVRNVDRLDDGAIHAVVSHIAILCAAVSRSAREIERSQGSCGILGESRTRAIARRTRSGKPDPCHHPCLRVSAMAGTGIRSGAPEGLEASLGAVSC